MNTKQTEALKLALEALEEINKLSIGENAICLPAGIDTAMDAIKQVLAQPEQGPVIGTKTWFEDGKVVTQHLTAKDIYKEPEPVIDKSAAVRIATALGWEPKRKPLTDEEIKRMAAKWFLPMYWSLCNTFARAIEAAHGIGEQK